MTNLEILAVVKDIERKQRRGDYVSDKDMAIYKLYGGMQYEVGEDK